MGNRVYVTTPIYNAIVAIHNAGHAVELEIGEGGNSHTVTNLIICVRHPDEVAHIHKVRVKHTSSYGGKFSEFIGMSDEFGDLCHYSQSRIDPFLEVVAANADFWREMSSTDPHWFSKMAKV